jgi:hypothetical protein
MKPNLFILGLSLGLAAAGCGDSAAAISCDELDCDDGNPCTADTCDPASVTCASVSLSDGAVCDLGGQPGECGAGVCVGLTCDDVDCDDGNPCTADSCDSVRVVCASAPVADATPCELDGDPAMCEAGVCTALTCEDLDCNDDNPCTLDSCDAETVACTTSHVADQLVCPERGAFGSCNQGICDLSQTVESGTILLTVWLGNPPQVAFYEVVCEGAVPFAGSFELVDDAWQAFIAMPVGRCTISSFALASNGERDCEVSLALDVTAGYLGETSQTTSCSR